MAAAAKHCLESFVWSVHTARPVLAMAARSGAAAVVEGLTLPPLLTEEPQCLADTLRVLLTCSHQQEAAISHHVRVALLPSQVGSCCADLRSWQAFLELSGPWQPALSADGSLVACGLYTYLLSHMLSTTLRQSCPVCRCPLMA